MPLSVPGRLFAGDEELGKRDDDYKTLKKSPLKTPTSWQSRKIPVRRNVKKIIYSVGALLLVYYFIKYIPTDVQHRNVRPSYRAPKPGVYDPWIPSTAQNNPLLSKNQHKAPEVDATNTMRKEQTKAPPTTLHNAGDDTAKEPHYYDGPIKFYELAATLHKAASETGGNFLQNSNVLFVAANLKSASLMLALACEMSEWKRNEVHFALLARDEISIESLKSMNSLDKECRVTFHDARPDFAAYSSDNRFALSASAALSHFERFLHPQAVIVDDSGTEEVPMLKAFRENSGLLGLTLIELCRDAAHSLRWFTRLDAPSLKIWSQVSIDVMIHAQEAASGSLIRLLTSLSKADYGSSLPPRLTVELPHKIDEPTEQFFKNFRWPPPRYGDGKLNLLTLRHRIPGRSASTIEVTSRMIESFWPTNPATSHVLVLSPHTELSPIYYQYLKYTLLEYKYSAAAALSPTTLFGISLDLPTTLLNDKEPLVPPPYALPFLWQAPNSNAALYFGTVWQELHSLLSHLSIPSTLPAPKTIDTKPQVSTTYPSWLEHLLTLARVRGYYMLYPSLSSTTGKLTTVHTELYQAPEDSLDITNSRRKNTDLKDLPSISDEYLSDSDDHLSLAYPESTAVKTNLLNVFFPESTLPSLNEMKFVKWSGEQVNGLAQSRETTEYAMAYRAEVGGCKEGERVLYKEGEVIDLFCYGHPEEPESMKVGSIRGAVVPPKDSKDVKSIDSDMKPVKFSLAALQGAASESSTIRVAKAARTTPTSKVDDTPERVPVDLNRHEHGHDRIPGTGLR